MNSLDITKKLDRLEVFEDRLGVRLSSLSAFFNKRDECDAELTIHGEVSTDSGTRIEKRIVRVCAAVYDDYGRVIAQGGYSSGYDFPGFGVFCIKLELPIDTVSKIRVYPSMF